MSREEQVIVYVMGMIDNARDHNIVKGGRFRLGFNGKKEYQQMKQEGFRPTQEEIEMVYTLLNDPPPEVLKALKRYRPIELKLSAMWSKIVSLFQRRRKNGTGKNSGTA